MLAERLTSQGLAGPKFTDPVDVVERLLAVQAQDGRGMRLAIRPRSKGVTAADVEQALTADRSLVVSWLNRGTLHLVRSEDFPWLHALTVHRLAKTNETRLGQEGVSPSKAELGAKTIVKLLANGPMGRDDLRKSLDSAGVPTAGQALVHILLFTTIRHSIIRGPVSGAGQQFVLAEDWLGPQPEIDPDRAAVELARRYLAGHGPADARELARWAGITLGLARKAFAGIAGEISERKDGLFVLKKGPKKEPLPPPRLLGSFDPLLHGWAKRDFLIPGEDDRAVVTTNGIFRPTILIDGQVAGTWTMPSTGVELKPFTPLDDKTEKALASETKAVQKYLGVDD
ncbi:MAG: winged helix DNA-binding domain-containing protein [Solirubrobacterales bacterium]